MYTKDIKFHNIQLRIQNAEKQKEENVFVHFRIISCIFNKFAVKASRIKSQKFQRLLKRFFYEMMFIF